MARCCVKTCVVGHVQGVGFRFHTAHQGLMLDLTGYARNLADGSVEVLACGEQVNIDSLLAWLQHGPKTATVENLTSETLAWQHLSGFQMN